MRTGPPPTDPICWAGFEFRIFRGTDSDGACIRWHRHCLRHIRTFAERHERTAPPFYTLLLSYFLLCPRERRDAAGSAISGPSSNLSRLVFPFFGGGIETIVSCTSSYSLPGINIRARTVLAHTTLEYAYITSIAVFKRTWMTLYAQLCFLIAAGVVGGCRGVGRGRRVPSSAGAPGPSQLPNPQPPQARDTVTCSRKLGGAHIRAVAERSATFRF